MSFPIKTYYKSELAGCYQVKLQTFMLWLKPFQDKGLLVLEHNQKLLKPIQVKQIIELLGEPMEPEDIRPKDSKKEA